MEDTGVSKYEQLKKLADALTTVISESSFVQEIFVEEKDDLELQYIIRENQIKKEYEALVDFLHKESTEERQVAMISMSAKCSDLFSANMYDKDKNLVREYSGYVPSYIPGSYGDYVNLDIEVETGMILNWRVPQEKEFFKK